jgi:hypothetical protein
LGHRAAGQIDIDGNSYGATAEVGRGAPAAQKGLVYIVMENIAKAVSILATKITRQRFGKSVANRVWMAKTLAFDNLDGIVSSWECRYRQKLHQ